MAVKVSIHRICDRCLHPFDEKNLKYGEELPKIERGQLRMEQITPSGSNILFSFDDLCGDCDRVVDGLIKKIKLEKDESPKAAQENSEKKAEKPAEKPENSKAESAGGKNEKEEKKKSGAHLF